jgi:hypothetical protein
MNKIKTFYSANSGDKESVDSKINKFLKNKIYVDLKVAMGAHWTYYVLIYRDGN